MDLNAYNYVYDIIKLIIIMRDIENNFFFFNRYYFFHYLYLFRYFYKIIMKLRSPNPRDLFLRKYALSAPNESRKKSQRLFFTTI